MQLFLENMLKIGIMMQKYTKYIKQNKVRQVKQTTFILYSM